MCFHLKLLSLSAREICSLPRNQGSAPLQDNFESFIPDYLLSSYIPHSHLLSHLLRYHSLLCRFHGRRFLRRQLRARWVEKVHFDRRIVEHNDVSDDVEGRSRLDVHNKADAMVGVIGWAMGSDVFDRDGGVADEAKLVGEGVGNCVFGCSDDDY